jgi:hypothetical protein
MDVLISKWIMKYAWKKKNSKIPQPPPPFIILTPSRIVQKHLFILLMRVLLRIITINVPVVFMAQYVMILRRAISITRAIIRGGP